MFDGKALVIGKTVVEKLNQIIKVYNFEVEDWHTYFVSDSEILVHNACTMNRELPSLDRTGKVHGELPSPKDLKNYSTEDLGALREELRQSVQQRIQKNIELGSDLGHGARQAAEQDLIKSIDKYLGD